MLLTLSAMFMSCSPKYAYFTDDLQKQNRWSESDLQRIQFYVSRDIVLYRTIQKGQSAIREGKILMRNGKEVEQVVIKEGTPGVLLFMPKEDRFAISFDDAGDEAYLMFGPNPKYHNRYALLAQEWERQSGKVHYKGEVYDVDTHSAFASLLVDLRRNGQVKYKSTTARGRKVGQ